MADSSESVIEQFEDQADTQPQRPGGRAKGGRGGRGGRGRGGGGGGGAGRLSRDVLLSKALSRLLRHQAASAGIELDKEGYAPLNKVLHYQPIRSLQPSFSEIANAVRTSDKQRFAMKPNPATNPSLDETSINPSHWLIRANQGHSIKLDSDGLLKPIVLGGTEGDPKGEEGSVPVPEVVVHGTYFAFWNRIVESGGLKPMGRNHVHFSTGLPEDEAGVISGMRRDAEILVYIDVAASLREGGTKWWMSENGVVLTEGNADGLVPTKFFKEVVGRTQNVGLLWKDGEKVADLPDKLRIRTPQGKGRGGGAGRKRGA